MLSWLRETIREPHAHLAADGSWDCSYCGKTLCVPVPGLDLDRVARAHYARAWRGHAAITHQRRSL